MLKASIRLCFPPSLDLIRAPDAIKSLGSSKLLIHLRFVFFLGGGIVFFFNIAPLLISKIFYHKTHERERCANKIARNT